MTPDEKQMISSPTNPRIKRLVRLRKRRARDEEQVVVVEGLAELHRAVDGGLTVREVYFNPGIVDAEALPAADSRLEVSTEAMAKATMRDSTEGLIAVLDQPSSTLTDLHLGPNPLLLVLEGIEKPGNLGAMFRTADAAGVDAVVIADPTTDVWNPNAVRASLGCVFTVPVAVASTDEVLEWLESHEVRLAATTPDTSVSLFDADLTGAVAIAVGAEHDGLSAAMLAAADIPVRIPMAGSADSLNASVSAAICLYEAVRQRA